MKGSAGTLRWTTSVRQRNVPFITAIVATVLAAGLAFWNSSRALPLLASLEGFTIDARFRMRGPRKPATDRIVIVGLDDDTHDKTDTVQSRRGYAKLIDAISAYHPKLIAVDVFFSSPEQFLSSEVSEQVRAVAASPPTSTPERAVLDRVAEELRGDDLLAAAIARNGRTVLGAYVVPGPPPAEPVEPPGLERARHGEVADAGGGGQLRPESGSGIIASMPIFTRGQLGSGLVNTLRDEDGVTRHMPLDVEYGGRHYMTLGLVVALIEQGTPGKTRYVVGGESLRAGAMRLPLSADASLLLDPLGKKQIEHVSAYAVLTGKVPREKLEGKLVFVGQTYSASDKVATPLDQAADGIELHATLAENILTGHIMRSTGTLAAVGATLLLGLIVAAAQLRRIRRRAWVPPLVSLAAITGYCAFSIAMFASGTVIAMATPVLLTLVVLVVATVSGLATEGREKAHLRGVFSQYVSRPVVDRILENPGRAKLGGERKNLTVLFSDIRGFSHVAESMQPEDLAAFLHEYLTPMTDLVLASGGMLDKYIGDAIMAIWGAPVDAPDHAAQACEVALRMHEALVELNRKWVVAGKARVAIGIGINTGAMSVGNMGSEARFEYTVLGDAVNQGARLEALTKEYGVGILVGEATASAAGDRFLFRELDLVRVKGRAQAIPVFELVGRAGKSDPTFARALALYRNREFAAARIAFASLPDDPAAAVMASRCDDLAAAPPPSDWDGVYDQRSK